MAGGVLLDQFIKTSAFAVRGRATADAMALGYPLTGGLFFPFRNGAFLMRRRRLYPTPARPVEQPWLFCGGGLLAATQIRNFPGFGHEASMGFQYAVGVAHGNGYVGDFSEPVRVDFDAGGALISPALPMWPMDVTAAPIVGGAFRVAWRYEPYGQGGPPTDFVVFEGPTAATIDYNTPIGTVASTVRRAYTFDTGGYADGSDHYFAVRARNASAIAERNTLTTSRVTAMAAAPTGASVQFARTINRTLPI